MSEMNDDVEEVDNYTNHDLVEQAFQECDISHEGRLSYQVIQIRTVLHRIKMDVWSLKIGDRHHRTVIMVLSSGVCIAPC